jgi:hypothetical protein
MTEWTDRIAAVDWAAVEDELNAWGAARLPGLLTPAECAEAVALYADEALFRKKVVMHQVGFGQGEYQYFDDPLPPLVAGLRAAAYPPLAAIANRWRARLGEEPLPDTLAAYRGLCRAAGQRKPTPLLLTYRAGDYNRLHQDVYGEVIFPLQVAVLLSRPGADFAGGHFVLTEQKPRSQSRPEVVDLAQGDAVIFPVSTRPAEGKRGPYRLTMRHGVSRLTRGARTTLGIIFHDAK